MKYKMTLILLMLGFVWTCSNPPVQTGLDNLSGYRHLFENKRVGIITNHTAYDSQHRHISDVFFNMENVTIAAFFGPEHGIRGQAEAGEKVASQKDPLKDIPIYSLYGKIRKPTAEMLKNVDVLVFDIQDIGARFYTYIYTMALAMEAAAEFQVPFVVLDRPNPITGRHVQGNLLLPEFATFVGLYPIPVRHGMTVGELAKMFNEESWLKDGVHADLTVVPLKHWRRSQWYDETQLQFTKPSPNIPSLQAATVYPGVCLLEGTNVSEGRGTPTPFLLFGAPWIDGVQLTNALNNLQLPGVEFKAAAFTPKSIPGAALHPKHENRECFGAEILITERDALQPYWNGIQIVNTIFQLYPDSLTWRIRHFDRLCGTATVRETIQARGELVTLRASWQPALRNFLNIRKKYLLYE
ncbi:MAG: exo-beta-N-acetylmuramidase NamZ domain-containing protein [bacterium]